MKPAFPLIVSALALATGVCAAAQAGDASPDAADLSLEELLRADVVTASRKSQAVQDVAAAVFVLTREDIERSGASSVPEVLRLVPGMQVARMSSSRWAVSARGFNGRFANKLLVLLDGRSIYSPLFSGVLWEVEGTLLEDIERIEVIRGPGAALWGANAVNGVINILTRKARDTQGNLLAAGAGNVEEASLAVRTGHGIGDSGAWRLWARSDAQRSFDDTNDAPGHDHSRTARAGFRADWALDSGDSLGLSGAVHRNTAGDRWLEADLLSSNGLRSVEHTQTSDAAHLLARYNRLAGDGSETVVQAYAEDSQVDATQVFNERRWTLDLDLQHRPRLGGAHDVVWGANLRVTHSRITSAGTIQFGSAPRHFTLASVFANDEIGLVPDKLRLTAGARLENNSFTGFEPQPQLRLAWTPSRSQTFWGALSRAVRTPSIAESDANIDFQVVQAAPPTLPLPLLIRAVAPPEGSLQAERVDALEFGVRQQLDPTLSVDMAAFHNRYTRLTGTHSGAQTFDPLPVPHLVLAIQQNNSLTGVTEGLEVSADWRVNRAWRLQAAGNLLRMRVHPTTDDPIDIAVASAYEATAPRRQLTLRSSLSLGSAGDLDARMRHVSALNSTTYGEAAVPAYTAFDLRYAVRPTPGWTLSVSGENLGQRRHAEFSPDLLPSQMLVVPRSVHFKAVWQF